MNSFDTKFYSLDTNVIKVDSCTNKLLVFNAETYIFCLLYTSDAADEL